MRSKRDFWKAQEDWSRRKHLILRYYLKPAAAKLASVSQDRSIYIIDGFAGRGRYKDGSAGSPVHMGELSDECSRWSSPVQLLIRNVEPNRKTFAALEAATAEWVAIGHYKNINSTFQDALSNLLRECATKPLFVFLDPFAPKHLLVDDVDPIMNRRTATEALIVFHTPLVFRTIMQVASSNTAPDTRESSAQTLDRIYGGNLWRDLLSQTVTPEIAVECFANSLLTRYPDVFVCIHGVVARKDTMAKYHVVFITRNTHGVALMNEAFVKEQQDVNSGNQFAIDFEEEERWNDFVTGLFAIEADAPGKVWIREELVRESIIRRFGIRLQKDHLQAIKQLMDSNTGPRLVPLDGRKTKAGTWITNDTTRLVFQLAP